MSEASGPSRTLALRHPTISRRPREDNLLLQLQQKIAQGESESFSHPHPLVSAPDSALAVARALRKCASMKPPSHTPDFPVTRWSLVLAASGRDGADARARAALDELCAQYWFPLYAFARRGGGGSHAGVFRAPAFARAFCKSGSRRRSRRPRSRATNCGICWPSCSNERAPPSGDLQSPAQTLRAAANLPHRIAAPRVR